MKIGILSEGDDQEEANVARVELSGGMEKKLFLLLPFRTWTDNFEEGRGKKTLKSDKVRRGRDKLRAERREQPFFQLIRRLISLFSRLPPRGRGRKRLHLLRQQKPELKLERAGLPFSSFFCQLDDKLSTSIQLAIIFRVAILKVYF